MISKYIFKINGIFTKQQKKQLIFFVFLSLFSMLLETLGIGLIIPFLNILTKDILEIQQYKIFNYFSIQSFSKADLIFFGIAILSTVYFFKALFLTYISHKEVNFIAKIRIEISESLYAKYLQKPYQYFLNNNSAHLIRNINDITVFLSLLKSLLMLVSESVILLGVCALLIIYEPQASILTMLILAILGFSFQKTIQKKTKKWGNERRRADAFRLMNMKEGFGAIKDIKILGRENFFIQNFSDSNMVSARTQQKQDFFVSLPRFWLEFIAIIGFSSLTLFLIDENGVALISTLGLFAVATFRLLPSVTRLMNSFQNVQYSAVVLDSMFEELNNQQSNYDFKKNKLDIQEKIKFHQKIELKNICFKYNETNKYILNDINFVVNKGSSVGIMGSSGVGKTTLINIILGLLTPNKGGFLVDGNIIKSSLIQDWQKNIGYVPQSIFLTDDTLRKNIAFGLPDHFMNDEKIKKSIKGARLENFIKSIDQGLDTKVGELGTRLSGGQIQRIGIARALYNDPDVIILDEFTSSLDSNTENEIIEEINRFKEQKTIIMISHKHSTLAKCDNIYELSQEGIIKI